MHYHTDATINALHFSAPHAHSLTKFYNKYTNGYVCSIHNVVVVVRYSYNIIIIIIYRRRVIIIRI